MDSCPRSPAAIRAVAVEAAPWPQGRPRLGGVCSASPVPRAQSGGLIREPIVCRVRDGRQGGKKSKYGYLKCGTLAVHRRVGRPGTHVPDFRRSNWRCPDPGHKKEVEVVKVAH